MGRKKKTISLIPDYDWPFEICIKLNRNRPRIAFLSGQPRSYYPDDPGYTKFGQTYGLPYPEDTATPDFVPSTDRLQKPVSLLGYGIGGLSAPRFAPLLNEDNPPPNIYQSELVPAPVKKSEKAKRMKWKDLVKHYEHLVEQQYAKYEEDERALDGGTEGPIRTRKSMKDRHKRLSRKRSTSPNIHPHHHLHIPSTRSRLGLNKQNTRSKKCRKVASAFGTGLQNPRFPKESVDDKIGVGVYEVNTPAMKPTFQITTPEGKLIPRVRLVCHPSGCDICMDCGRELFHSDYYQTINKYQVQNKLDLETEGKFKMRHLSLCRGCYCEALKKGCHLWPKEKVPQVFMKARHCNSVHDHKEGHPEFLMKSTCKGMLSLARRELLYSRYFKDDPCMKAR